MVRETHDKAFEPADVDIESPIVPPVEGKGEVPLGSTHSPETMTTHVGMEGAQRKPSLHSHPIQSLDTNSVDEQDRMLYPAPSIAAHELGETPAKDGGAIFRTHLDNGTPRAPLVHGPIHTPKDPEAFYRLDHKKEREERQQRRDELRPIREKISEIPTDHWWEIPGKPDVVYAMKDYRRNDVHEGRRAARDELPFLFKAFEQGQAPPPRPGTKKADKPRAATIHEYLDWTVTASVPQDPDELDFDGFRVLVLYPRFKLWWPPPTEPYNSEIPLKHPQMGAPKPPIPHIQVFNKPICAATVRIGPSWVEVPFYATQEVRRNKGNGRALLSAIEDLCRHMKIPRILLCSTDDPKVKGTWSHLGFEFTTKEQLESFGVSRHDLLHMDNTVQMHKDVPLEDPEWNSVIIKHKTFKHRLYYVRGGGTAPPIPDEIVSGMYYSNRSRLRSLAPAKKMPSKRKR